MGIVSDLSPVKPSIRETVNLDDLHFDVKGVAGETLIQRKSTVMLALVGSEIVLPIQVKERVVLGRQEPSKLKLVDIDLTPYSALEKGVSRRHASLYQMANTLSLVDLGSNNGTYLNGSRLLPHQPRVLRHRDELAFGKLVFIVYFE